MGPFPYAAVDLHTTQLPMTVFVAAPGHAAHLEQDWTLSERALAVDLVALPKGGSVIFAEATGALPGLKGRLNPIRDTHDRTYLYASNIAIDEGKQQPVHFIPGEELKLTDVEGSDCACGSSTSWAVRHLSSIPMPGKKVGDPAFTPGPQRIIHNNDMGGDKAQDQEYLPDTVSIPVSGTVCFYSCADQCHPGLMTFPRDTHPDGVVCGSASFLLVLDSVYPCTKAIRLGMPGSYSYSPAGQT